MKLYIKTTGLLIAAALSLGGCSSVGNEFDVNDKSDSDIIIDVSDEDSTDTESESDDADESDSESVSDTSTETDEVVIEEKESERRITSFVVPKNRNKNMCEDIVGKISDNQITLEVVAPTDTYSLRYAYVEIETDAERVVLSSYNGTTADLTAEDLRCTITDEDGLERVYDIVIKYSEHTIPVISIDTSSAVISREDYISAQISIDTSGVSGWFLPEGFSSLDKTEVQIKGRGNSTWGWPKKPYKLKFETKTSVLGMEEAKKWILLSNYADYSLIRNYVAMEASK
ncbi:MAG: hypothetical protein E7672_05880, partial [Ruminococcaceae bacterium]|nr:hypothetical protein [Oscillospiraceae bacterium]